MKAGSRSCEELWRVFCWGNMRAWQEGGVSRTGSSAGRQTELQHWGKQSIRECKWSSLCQQTRTFSPSWINISASQSVLSHKAPGATSHSSLPVATPRLLSVETWQEGGGRVSRACYQRACWMTNTKSLTCDPVSGEGREERVFGEEIPWASGRPHKETDSSNRRNLRRPNLTNI